MSDMSFIEEQDYTKKFDPLLFKKLFVHMRKHWKAMGFVAAMMAIMAITDVFFPLLTRHAIDNYILSGADAASLWPFALLYLALIILQVIVIFLFILVAGRVEHRVAYDMRQKGFKKLQELPFSYYDRTSVGYLMSRLTSDTSNLSEAFGWGLVDLVWASFFLVSVTTAMLIINWQLALIVIAVVPVLVVITIWFQKRILKAQREVRKINSRITGSFNEGIMGAKTTKTLVREEQNTAEFKELSLTMRRNAVRAATLSSLFLPLVIAISSLASAFVLGEGASRVLSGALTLGTLTAFVNYSVQFFNPIRDIAGTFAEMQRIQAAAERVVSLLETESDIKDTEEVIAKYGDNFHPKTENWEKIVGEVEFRDVTFKYKDGEEVLKNFNLKVAPGETIAIVGPTGAGKSTIVNLLCRFYEPTQGSILIDGKDYRERSQLWLQSDLGYVLQEPHLFSGTVMDNLRYADPDATEEEAIKAAKLVNADTFIQKMDKGYNSEVGEGGSRLSTGEKQLVSFARAILHDPMLFILDEATSSVDTETEMMIQHAIEKTLEGRTSFIIAHRLSTIRSADRILLLEDGKITEEGRHEELLRRRGAYYELYTNQFREEAASQVLGKKDGKNEA
ncbi:MAG: ABC transporter ATP-binding protein [Clostridiales bacterium]|jgi:ATP-binding cassette subfamily B protein|nr:ABC transporter ATP-binding protein [Clostridiales bacterium]